jgi:hypothetical protein
MLVCMSSTSVLVWKPPISASAARRNTPELPE